MTTQEKGPTKATGVAAPSATKKSPKYNQLPFNLDEMGQRLIWIVVWECCVNGDRDRRFQASFHRCDLDKNY